MKIRILALSVVAALAAAAGYTQAQPPGGGGGRGGMFERLMSRLPVLVALDADKDMVISAEEIANASAALKTLDKDGSGALEMEELTPEFGGGGSGGRPGGFGGRPGGGGGGAAPSRPPVE